MSAAMGFFTMGLKNVFEIAVVNEPSVFEPLKFYCIKILPQTFGYSTTDISYVLTNPPFSSHVSAGYSDSSADETV